MSDHDIVPVPGSVVREGLAVPASLTVPGDYPVLAMCTCGGMIRCERWIASEGDWEHVSAA